MSKSLEIQQLDAGVMPFRALNPGPDAKGGWIAAVIHALGIPARTLAARLGVAPAQVTRVQQREATGAVTLASLRRVADALECDVVYAFVPRGGSFAAIVERQARIAATARLAEVEQTMRLENQQVPHVEQQRQVDELAAELARSRPAWMWDAPGRR